jgi:hypothetical protein
VSRDPRLRPYPGAVLLLAGERIVVETDRGYIDARRADGSKLTLPPLLWRRAMARAEVVA